MNRHRNRPPAFTLIELLVVLAIVTILLGVLLPSLGTVRANAKFTVCATNLRTIGQLLTAYAQENDGRVPRGPSYAGNPNPLLAPDIATSQVWMGQQFTGVPWRQYVVNPATQPTVTVPPQYVGLGMLAKHPGSTGNEFLFCPGADQDDQQQAEFIGTAGNHAESSYLYRQLDLTSPAIFLEGRLDNLAGNDSTAGGGNRYNFLQDRDKSESLYAMTIPIAALAMDADRPGTREVNPLNPMFPADTVRSNHDGKRLNIVFLDGSVAGFDNDEQAVRVDGSFVQSPWGDLRAEAFPVPSQVQNELDRIFATADIAYKNLEPWSFTFADATLPSN